MINCLLFLFCLIFVELFILLKIMKDVRSVLDLSKEASRVLMSKEMSDDEKEVFIRRSSLGLFKSSFILMFKFICIIFVLYALYFGINLYSTEIGYVVLKGFQSLKILAVLTAVTMLYVWIRMSFTQNYSIVDRILHYIAFSIPFVQKILYDLENDIFKKQLRGVKSQREVFVTGLPRAGTTLVLELLYKTGEFRTFTYRNMPFILSPLLWEKMSKGFRKEGAIMERAHGDGMEVSFDSPEAFEEIIWQAYLNKKIVAKDCLNPLFPGDETREFVDAFRNTVRKLILLNESEDDDQSFRYLSKNNANYSRLELITALFPSSVIIVPFRHPLAHVSSLMKQHENFSSYHQKDRFAKRYMKWLGHYDFGENFKPINFDQWVDSNEKRSYDDPNFWMAYWAEAYSHVLKHKTDNVYLVDFDKFLKDGKQTLQAIADCLELSDKNRLVDAASTLRSPTSKPFETQQFSPDILKSAFDVYEKLKIKAIFR